MNTHADKTQENKSHTVATKTAPKQSVGKSTNQFADSRPEAVAQKKMQEMANASPQVSQLKAVQDMSDNHIISNQPIQKKENNTGLPDNLKTGTEQLSGYTMDDVKVHYNSDKPTQLEAHAYAQGTDIHLGPGQEKHLPHEAWHVVQQKQGRVKPTMQMKGKVNVSDGTVQMVKPGSKTAAVALTQGADLDTVKGNALGAGKRFHGGHGGRELKEWLGNKNDGNIPTSFMEYDVNGKIAGQSRDGERLVVGTTASNTKRYFYTNDHYKVSSWTEIS